MAAGPAAWPRTEVAGIAFAAGVRVHHLAAARVSLEQAFMELTADSVEYHAALPDRPALGI